MGFQHLPVARYYNCRYSTVYWHRASSSKGDAIPESVERVGRFAEGMSFEDFRGVGNTVDDAARNTSVIDEATRHVPEEIRKLYRSIPWRG